MTNTQYTKREKLLFYEFFRTDYSHIEYFKEKEHQYLQYDVTGVTKSDLETINEIKCRNIDSDKYNDYFIEWTKFEGLYKEWLKDKSRIYYYILFFNNEIVKILLNGYFTLHQVTNLQYVSSSNNNINYPVKSTMMLPKTTFENKSELVLTDVVVIQKYDTAISKQFYKYDNRYTEEDGKINYDKINSFILKRFPNNNS